MSFARRQRSAVRGGVYPSLDEYYHEMGRSRALRPRGRIALDMYATGAAKTLKEAAEAVGLSPQHLSNLLNKGGGGEHVENTLMKLEGTAIETSAMIEKLGRKAIAKLERLMDTAGSEGIQLRAAIDLADRSPEMAKTHKVQADVFSMGPAEARALADAMVLAASVKAEFHTQVQGDFVKNEVPLDPSMEVK